MSTTRGVGDPKGCGRRFGTYRKPPKEAKIPRKTARDGMVYDWRARGWGAPVLASGLSICV
jgi:hypothetical protein